MTNGLSLVVHLFVLCPLWQNRVNSLQYSTAEMGHSIGLDCLQSNLLIRSGPAVRVRATYISEEKETSWIQTPAAVPHPIQTWLVEKMPASLHPATRTRKTKYTQAGHILLSVLFPRRAVYGSNALKNSSFGRSGIGDNQRHKELTTPVQHKQNKTKANIKERNRTGRWWRTMTRTTAADF